MTELSLAGLGNELTENAEGTAGAGRHR